MTDIHEAVKQLSFTDLPYKAMRPCRRRSKSLRSGDFGAALNFQSKVIMSLAHHRHTQPHNVTTASNMAARLGWIGLVRLTAMDEPQPLGPSPAFPLPSSSLSPSVCAKSPDQVAACRAAVWSNWLGFGNYWSTQLNVSVDKCYVMQSWRIRSCFSRLQIHCGNNTWTFHSFSDCFLSNDYPFFKLSSIFGIRARGLIEGH